MKPQKKMNSIVRLQLVCYKDVMLITHLSGVKSFESGAPTHITMALSFMETEMLTKEKINDGF